MYDETHCARSVRIRSFSGPYSVRLWENADQKTLNTDTFYTVITTSLGLTIDVSVCLCVCMFLCKLGCLLVGTCVYV